MPSNKRSSGRQPLVENDTIDQTNGESPAEPAGGETRGGDQPAASKAADQPPPARASEPSAPPRGADSGGGPRNDAPPARQGESGAPAREEGRRGRGLNITDLKDKSIQQLTQIAKDLNVAG